MSKYEPLTKQLSSLRYEEWRTTFAGLERLLGFRLPKSARSHRAWWSNNDSNSVMTRAWLAAGWRTEQVDMERETLVFRKAKPRGGSDARQSAAASDNASRPTLFGALAGTVSVPSVIDLTRPTDEVWDADRR